MFILSKDIVMNDPMDAASYMEAVTLYKQYLLSNCKDFPDSAYEFASANWHRNKNDPKAIWGSEFCSVKLNSTNRSIFDIEMILRGAFHNGDIFLKYINVSSYLLNSSGGDQVCREIYRDEIRLSEKLEVIHDIEWLGGEIWTFECSDISFEWREKEASITSMGSDSNTAT